MSIYAPEGNQKTFAPHAAGNFAATLYDMYVLEEVNYFHGKTDSQGQIDTRMTSQKLYLCFLTSAKTEDGKPCFIRHGLSFSLGKNAKLTATLKAWLPALRGIENLAAHFDRSRGVSLETLIGSTAFLNISHTAKGEKVYDKVETILALPKFDPETGAPIAAVEIPKDQKRADSNKLQIKAYQRVIEKFPQARKNLEAAIAKIEANTGFMDGLQEPPAKAAPAEKYESPAADAGEVDSDLPF